MKNSLILHLGSNLGKRQIILESAIASITQQLGPLIERSSFYETQPWLGSDPSAFPKEIREQTFFLNIALSLEVTVTPAKALDICQSIETKLGRIRKQKWEARAIDIDLIFYNDEVIHCPKLTLPHPWMQDRRFVLTPLAEIIPNRIHPIFKKTIQELLDDCKDEGQVHRQKNK